MRAVLVLAVLLIAACEAHGPQIAPIPQSFQLAPIPQTGERPVPQDMPAPGFIDHHPATGHLVV
jgi:hypothetical protein